MNSNVFDRFSFRSLLLLVFLLPLFCLPFTNIPIETSKGLLLVIGLIFSFVFWGLARFSDGKITMPRSRVLAAGAVVVVTVLISAILAPSSPVSFFGLMFDTGSFWFIFASFMLMLLCSIVFRNPKVARVLLFGAILSSAVLLAFQALHLYAPGILSLGILDPKTGTIFGSWNSFGLFAGFAGLMSLLVIEFFSITKSEKLLFQLLTVFSLVLVAVVNFWLAWVLMGISSLVIFVYKVSTEPQEPYAEEDSEKKRIPFFSLFIVVMCLLFFFGGSSAELATMLHISRPFGQILPAHFGISNVEVGPNLGATWIVTKGVLHQSPFFGIGPNKFLQAWALYKPAVINQSFFWDVPFSSGSGLLPTIISTTGYVGLLAWLLFFILFIWSGIKSIFSSAKTNTNWETMAFFVMALYLFIACMFYSTGMAVFVLAFAFAGVFVGLSTYHSLDHENREITFTIAHGHKRSFVSTLFIAVILIGSLGLSFMYIERLASVSYFEKSVIALKAGDVASAESAIGSTLRLYSNNDLYLRTYGQIYINKLNILLKKQNLTTDEQKLSGVTLKQAIDGAKLAVAFDPTNYLNFQTLGFIYQTAGSFGADNGYANAIEAYKASATLNPLNPGIKLALATASLGNKNTKDAKDYANAAITLKPDYVDALIALSQMAKSSGDNAAALDYAKQALAIVPDNKDLMKYTDSLKNPNSASIAPASDTSSPDSTPTTTGNKNTDTTSSGSKKN